MLRSFLAAAALLLLPACSSQPICTPDDHCTGKRFFNPDGEQGSGGRQAEGPLRLIAALVHPPHRTWPASVPVRLSRPPARVEDGRMLVTWIGHSTVLVQTEGLNILTDPVWAERASPASFIGTRRVREPGIRFDDLPPVDVVLLSHDHFDHLDSGAMIRLWRRDRPLIVGGLRTDRLLARHGVPAIGADWGERVRVRPGVDVVLERAHHWSQHGLRGRDKTLWTGFTVTLPGGNLYYAGDTGPGDMRWAAEAARRGPVRLALLPIGAYHFTGPRSGNHIGPRDAVTAFRQLGAAYALGVHWGTFELTSEPIDAPREGLATALRQDGIAPDRFRTLEAGGQWWVPARAASRDREFAPVLNGTEPFPPAAR